ncbi:MAG: hypothetical protein NT062_33300 [Proteobacteria bacterium]|nr:hypothetical protein [Pseudomonadota bacterium]
MRTIRTSISRCALVALSLAGCQWTEFDDLEAKAWVQSTEKPDANSNDYGVALARGLRTSADGGTLVVLGAGQALYTELVYTATGAASLDAKTELKLNNQFGIGNLDLQPVLIADTATDDVALVTNSGGDGSIALLAGTHTMTSSQIFGPSTPDAATYMRVASQAAAPKPSQILVAALDAVYGSGIMPQPVCHLVDADGTPVSVRGIAAARITQTDFDDLVVWSAEGKLYLYDGNAFDGCATPALPLSVPVDVGFKPEPNASMHLVDGHFLVLAGHHQSDAASRIAVYDLTAMNATPAREPKLIGAPLDRDGMKATTILAAEGTTYVMAGYPLASVDGTVAGEVLAFELDVTTGIDPTPVATLHDASPESNQQFGRALTTFPYNGKSILAVSADNEVFAYYQSPLYGETRR